MTLDDGQITDYAGQIAILKDDDLVEETRRQIDAAGWERRSGASDQRAGLCHAECGARGKPFLYQRGWNKAAHGNDVEVTSCDCELARDPIAA